MKKFTAIFITLILILTTTVSAVDLSTVDFKNYDWRSFKGLNIPFERGDYYAKTVKKVIDEENFIGFVGLNNEDEKYYLSYYEDYYKGKGDMTLYDMWYYSAYNYAGELVEKLAKDYAKEDAMHAFDGNEYGTEIYSYQFTYTAEDGRRMRRNLALLKYGEDLYIYEYENTEEKYDIYGEGSNYTIKWRCFFGEPLENFEENKDEIKPPEKPIDIIINGENIIPDSNPLIINDRTLVPIRAVAEKLGYNVGWIGETRTATISNSNVTLNITIDAPDMVKEVNGNSEIIHLDVCASIINDRTYLPLRAVGEALGATVSWNGENRAVIIEKSHEQTNEEIVVYIGETGSKYHKQNCRTLKNGAIPVSLDFVLSQGREACKVCH